MRCRLLPVSPGSHDLGLQKSDARIKLFQRIAIQAFAGEEAGGSEVEVFLGGPPPRSIVVVHCDAASDLNLSMSMA